MNYLLQSFYEKAKYPSLYLFCYLILCFRGYGLYGMGSSKALRIYEVSQALDQFLSVPHPPLNFIINCLFYRGHFCLSSNQSNLFYYFEYRKLYYFLIA